MGDMFDCGAYCFGVWAKGGYIAKDLGPFNPRMPIDEVHKRLDHVGKISDEGMVMFTRGWESAKEKFITGIDPKFALRDRHGAIAQEIQPRCPTCGFMGSEECFGRDGNCVGIPRINSKKE